MNEVDRSNMRLRQCIGEWSCVLGLNENSPSIKQYVGIGYTLSSACMVPNLQRVMKAKWERGHAVEYDVQ